MSALKIGELSFELELDAEELWNDRLKDELVNFIRQSLDGIEVNENHQPIDYLQLDIGEWTNSASSKNKLRNLLINALDKSVSTKQSGTYHVTTKKEFPKIDTSSKKHSDAKLDESESYSIKELYLDSADEFKRKLIQVDWRNTKQGFDDILQELSVLLIHSGVTQDEIKELVIWLKSLTPQQLSEFLKLLQHHLQNPENSLDGPTLLDIAIKSVYQESLLNILQSPISIAFTQKLAIKAWGKSVIPRTINTLFVRFGFNPNLSPQRAIQVLSNIKDDEISGWIIFILLSGHGFVNTKERLEFISKINDYIREYKEVELRTLLASDRIFELLPSELHDSWKEQLGLTDPFKTKEFQDFDWFSLLRRATPHFDDFLDHYSIEFHEFNAEFDPTRWSNLSTSENQLLKHIWTSIYSVVKSQKVAERVWTFNVGLNETSRYLEQWKLLISWLDKEIPAVENPEIMESSLASLSSHFEDTESLFGLLLSSIDDLNDTDKNALKNWWLEIKEWETQRNRTNLKRSEIELQKQIEFLSKLYQKELRFLIEQGDYPLKVDDLFEFISKGAFNLILELRSRKWVSSLDALEKDQLTIQIKNLANLFSKTSERSDSSIRSYLIILIHKRFLSQIPTIDQSFILNDDELKRIIDTLQALFEEVRTLSDREQNNQDFFDLIQKLSEDVTSLSIGKEYFFNLLPLPLKFQVEFFSKTYNLPFDSSGIIDWLPIPQQIWKSLQRLFKEAQSKSETDWSAFYKWLVEITYIHEILPSSIQGELKAWLDIALKVSREKLIDAERETYENEIRLQHSEQFFTSNEPPIPFKEDVIGNTVQKIPFYEVYKHPTLWTALLMNEGTAERNSTESKFQQLVQDPSAHLWFNELRKNNAQGTFELSQILTAKQIVHYISKKYIYQFNLQEEKIWQVHRFLRDKFGLGVALKFHNRLKFRLMMIDRPQTKLDIGVLLTEELFLMQPINIGSAHAWLKFIKELLGFEGVEMSYLDNITQLRLKKQQRKEQPGDKIIEAKNDIVHVFTNWVIENPRIQTAQLEELWEIFLEENQHHKIESEPSRLMDKLLGNLNESLSKSVWTEEVKDWVQVQILSWMATEKKTPLLGKLIANNETDFWDNLLKQFDDSQREKLKERMDYLNPTLRRKLQSYFVQYKSVVDVEPSKSTSSLESIFEFEEVNIQTYITDWVNPNIRPTLNFTVQTWLERLQFLRENTSKSISQVDENLELFRYSFSNNILGKIETLIQSIYDLVMDSSMEKEKQEALFSELQSWARESLIGFNESLPPWLEQVLNRSQINWTIKLRGIIDRLVKNESQGVSESEIHSGKHYSNIRDSILTEFFAFQSTKKQPNYSLLLDPTHEYEQNWYEFEVKTEEKHRQNRIFWNSLREDLLKQFQASQVEVIEIFSKKIISRIPESQNEIFKLWEEIAQNEKRTKQELITELFLPRIMKWVLKSGIENHSGMNHLVWTSSILASEIIPTLASENQPTVAAIEARNHPLYPVILEVFPDQPKSREKATNLLAFIDDSSVKEIQHKIEFEYKKKHQDRNYMDALFKSELKTLFSENSPLEASILSSQIEEPSIDNELKKEIDKGTRFKTSHCGMMLLGPFYSSLFRRLGWLEKQAFISETEQIKAYFLLTYIAEMGMTDEQKEEGSQDLIPRIIAGIPAESEIKKEVDITESEKEECHTFLRAIISQWPIMSNVSIEGFVESFLNREGVAFKRDSDTWNIEVEGKGADMVLKTIPWGYGTVKFPWAPYIVYTTWEIP